MPTPTGLISAADFEYPAGNPGRLQREPERQAADAGPDDNDVVHVPSRHFIKRLPG